MTSPALATVTVLAAAFAGLSAAIAYEAFKARRPPSRGNHPRAGQDRQRGTATSEYEGVRGTDGPARSSSLAQWARNGLKWRIGVVVALGTFALIWRTDPASAVILAGTWTAAVAMICWAATSAAAPPSEITRRPEPAPGVYVIRRTDDRGVHWKIGRSDNVARRWRAYENQVRTERTLSPYPLRIEFCGYIPVDRAGSEKRLERYLHREFAADRVRASGAGRELFARSADGPLDAWLTKLGLPDQDGPV